MVTMRSALLRVPNSLRGRLRRAFRQAVGGQDASNGKREIYLGDVNAAIRIAVKNLYGSEVTKQIITTRDVVHIYRHHGKNTLREAARGQIPVTEDIVALIPDILNNPKSVVAGKQTSKLNTVIVSKEYSDGTAHLIAVVMEDSSLKIHTLWVWNPERSKKESVQGLYDCFRTPSAEDVSSDPA